MLVPFLVDKDNVGQSGMKAIQSMMVMRPAPDFQVGTSCSAFHFVIQLLKGLTGTKCALYSSCFLLQPGNGFVNVEGQQQQVEQRAQRSPVRLLQLYEPAVTASWRLRLLRTGNVPDDDLRSVK